MFHKQACAHIPARQGRGTICDRGRCALRLTIVPSARRKAEAALNARQRRTMAIIGALAGRTATLVVAGLGLSVQSGPTADTAGGASPCCISTANSLHAEAVTGWFTRASRKIHLSAASSGLRRSGCGSAASGDPFDPFPEKPRGMWKRGDHMAKAPLQLDAGEEIDIVRDCRHGGAQYADIDPADLILSHERDRVGLQDAHAMARAALHQHLQQHQIIRCSGMDPAAAGEGLRRGWPFWLMLHRVGFQRPVRQTVMAARLARPLCRRNHEAGVVHAERLENVFAEMHIQGFATHRLHDATEGQIERAGRYGT
jgi:hypothetical protein